VTARRAPKKDAAKEPIQLSSGARLFVEPDPVIPLVDVDIVLRGGSIHDIAGREGLSRIFARLVRRGTAASSPMGALTAEALDEAIESLGAAVTIDITPTALRFHGSVIRRNLEPFLRLLASLLLAPALRPRDLAYVRREAQAELISQLDSDRWLGARAFRHALFGTHPYGRSTSGTPRSLAAIRLPELRALHETRVRAGDVIVGLAGDVTPEVARSPVEPPFPPLPRALAPAVVVVDAQPRPGVHVVLVDKPDRTQTQLYVGTLGARMGEDDFYPLVVANTCFGGTFTARLVAEVRSKRGWSYSAQSRLYADRGRDAWVVYTHPSVENARDCLALELDLVRAFVQRGVRPRELAFARSYLTKSHAFERDTAAKRLEPRVEASLFGLPLAFFEDYERNVAAVDAPAASAAVARRLGGSGGAARDLTVAIVGPAARLERSLATLPDIASIEVVPHDRVTAL